MIGFDGQLGNSHSGRQKISSVQNKRKRQAMKEVDRAGNWQVGK